MDLALNGKVAIITGTSRGICKSCALALAEEKCHLTICSRDKVNLDKAKFITGQAINVDGGMVKAII